MCIVTQRLHVGRISNTTFHPMRMDFATTWKMLCSIMLYEDLMEFWRSEFPNSFYDLNYEELVINQEKRPDP